MRIIQATANEIIIEGVVPIDKVPPLKKSGKPASPDPIIRICHGAKKELLEEPGVCIAYNVTRPTTNSDDQVTKIRFWFSSTGKIKLPTINDIKKLEAEEAKYCQMMSVLCAERIEAYLSDIEFANH